MHGFYLHGVPITKAAVLPDDWENRTIPIRNRNTRGMTGLCLESHDLAASKLAAFRDKDRAFVRVLLAERMIQPRELIARIELLPVPPDTRSRLIAWVKGTSGELALGQGAD